MIPLSAPHLRLKRYSAAVDGAIARVLAGGQFILGEEVDRFENSFAAYLDVRYCIGVNSGTDALILALRALGIGHGDEVITVSMTFAGTAMAILHVGGEPRFVDIDPLTRCIDLTQVESAITPRTAAIIPVHLHGHPVDMPSLLAVAERHRLAVVEDCAQAHGARVAGRSVGAFGHLGAFSFYPTKNLGCAGDGGAIVTNDPNLAGKLRSLRHYGWPEGARVSADLGYNSRLDELQAAVLNVLLPHLDEGNAERRSSAERYRELLSGLGVGLPPQHDGAVYHQFAITVPDRDKLQRFLLDQVGIGTGVHYANPVHAQRAFAGFAKEPLPETDGLAKRLLSIPIQPEVVGDRLAYVVEGIGRGVRA